MIPTPTPLPVVTPQSFDAIGQMDLWDLAPIAIQGWNMFEEITTVFQAILLIGVVIFILMHIYRAVRNISVEKNQ